jgi:hypothetical protein
VPAEGRHMVVRMFGQIAYRRLDLVPALMMSIGVLVGTLLIFTF